MEDRIINAKDIIPEVYEEAKKRHNRGKDLSISSMPGIDKMLWGFRKKKLITVAARPSQGKSVFGIQLAYDFARQGKKVYFFTFEMTPAVCIERLLCSQLKIDNYLLNTGKIAEHPEYDQKVDNFYKGFPTSLVIIDQIGRNIKQLLDAIQKLGSDVDAVFIDYIQLIKGLGNRSDKQNMDEYLIVLREEAIKHNFCAVIMSQINRDTHKGAIKPPSIWEIKGTGTVEEHSDIIILLHWEYFYTREEDKKNDYWLRIAKNRDGKTGIFDKLRFYPEHYRLQEAPREEDDWVGF